MKLMINIPDEAYELLKSKSELDNIAESIIANGTPINTDGDLISRNVLQKWIDDSVSQYGNQYSADMLNMFGLFREIIDNAPTVKIDTNDIEYKAYCKGLEDGKKIARPQGKMTNDLISREALKEEVKKYLEKRQDVIVWESDIYNIIENAPTVEPEKAKEGELVKAYTKGFDAGVETARPQGEWNKEQTIYGWDGKSYQCSVCGRSVHLDTEVEDINLDYPFCHCGARMVGREFREKECIDNSKEFSDIVNDFISEQLYGIPYNAFINEDIDE